MNRRQFLGRVECLSAGALASGLSLPLAGCIGFHYVNTAVAGDQLVIRLEDLGGRTFALVDAPGLLLPLFVSRKENGEFSAVSTRCMHRGCQVEPAADRLVCPCHGSEYTNTGDVLKGPTRRPLRSLPVRLEDDRILIELPKDGAQW